MTGSSGHTHERRGVPSRQPDDQARSESQKQLSQAAVGERTDHTKSPVKGHRPLRTIPGPEVPSALTGET